MVAISQPSAVWQQVSSMFFLLSGFFNDLLPLRVALTLANLFLLVTGEICGVIPLHFLERNGR
jgi:hypothetical protein